MEKQRLVTVRRPAFVIFKWIWHPDVLNCLHNNNNYVGQRLTLCHGLLIKASIQRDNSRKRIAVLLKSDRWSLSQPTSVKSASVKYIKITGWRNPRYIHIKLSSGTKVVHGYGYVFSRYGEVRSFRNIVTGVVYVLSSTGFCFSKKNKQTNKKKKQKAEQSDKTKIYAIQTTTTTKTA